MQTGSRLCDETEQRVKRVALGPGGIGSLPPRRVGADVGGVEVDGDDIVRARDPKQFEGTQVDISERFVELPDVSQREAS
jgi:hypothetical protein